MINIKKQGSIHGATSTQMIEGVTRKTLLYNDEILMVEFTIQKGAHLPLHQHINTQCSYIKEGCLIFFDEDGRESRLQSGDARLFLPGEPHGAKALENSKIIDVFTPSRDDYKDE